MTAVLVRRYLFCPCWLVEEISMITSAAACDYDPQAERCYLKERAKYTEKPYNFVMSARSSSPVRPTSCAGAYYGIDLAKYRMMAVHVMQQLSPSNNGLVYILVDHQYASSAHLFLLREHDESTHRITLEAFTLNKPEGMQRDTTNTRVYFSRLYKMVSAAISAHVQSLQAIRSLPSGSPSGSFGKVIGYSVYTGGNSD